MQHRPFRPGTSTGHLAAGVRTLLFLTCFLLPFPCHGAGNDAQPPAEAKRLTWFVEDLVGTPPAPEREQPSMEEIDHELQKLEKRYVELLDRGNGATGLFATGEYSNDTANGEDRYYGQLELRLFNDGLVEELRKKDKKILQTRLELLQLNRDMADRSLGSRLYRVHTWVNNVRYRHNLRLIELLAPELRRRRLAGRQGYATGTDILALRHALTTARQEMKFYRRQERGRLEPQLAELLNRVEQLDPRRQQVLRQMARDNDPTLQIQEIFTRRAEQYPAWSDNLAVDLFAGHKKEYYDRERDYIGIRLEIPLSWDDRTDELIDLQQRIYRTQKQAVARRLDEKLDRLSALLGFHQQKIRTRIDALVLLLAEEKAARMEMANPVQRQGADPRRTLHLLERRIADTRFAALEDRLRVYELGLRIMALTGMKEFTELFESPR